MLFAYLTDYIKSRRDLLFVLALLLAGLLLQGLIMIGLRVTGSSVRVAGISAVVDDNSRVAGTIGSPNTAASYLELLLAPALALLLTPVGRHFKSLAAAAFVLGSVAMIFTGSRGGWGAAAVSVVLVMLMARRHRLLAPAAFGCVAIFALAPSARSLARKA